MPLRQWMSESLVSVLRAVPRQQKIDAVNAVVDALLRGIPPAELVEIGKAVLPRLVQAFAGVLTESDKVALARDLVSPERVAVLIRERLPALDAVARDLPIPPLPPRPEEVAARVKEMLPSVVAGLAEHERLALLKELVAPAQVEALFKERLPVLMQSAVAGLSQGERLAMLKATLSPEAVTGYIRELLPDVLPRFPGLGGSRQG